jgi:hypothetical protein
MLADAINEVLEFFTGFEVRDFLLRDVDFFPRFGVPSLSGLPFANSETPEAANFQFVAIS